MQQRENLRFSIARNFFRKYSTLAKRSGKNTILRESSSTPVIVRVGTALRYANYVLIILCPVWEEYMKIYNKGRWRQGWDLLTATRRLKGFFSNKTVHLFLSFSWISVGMKLKNENWSGARTACNVPFEVFLTPPFTCPSKKKETEERKLHYIGKFQRGCWKAST